MVRPKHTWKEFQVLPALAAEAVHVREGSAGRIADVSAFVLLFFCEVGSQGSQL